MFRRCKQKKRTTSHEPNRHDEHEVQKAEDDVPARQENHDLDKSKWWNVADSTDCFPQSKEQAREHIEWIWAQKRVYKSETIAEIADAALNKFAVELYSGAIHFLFEIIQNADDAQYSDNTVPVMTITYREVTNSKRVVRFDYNEIGFNSADVESLCSLGKSSKVRSKRRKKRHIGEKGVGFKSVFEVADVVWVGSGYYSFKFDNSGSEKLGMIVPLWDKFPNYEPRLSGHTTILLELLPKVKVTDLVKTLEHMDPSILLFLNTLKQINIKVIEADHPLWKRCIERQNEISKQNNMSVCSIKHGADIQDYYVFHHEVTTAELGKHEQRQGDENSDIMLAFPVISKPSVSNEQEIPGQHVFAFLPIWDYGFKFILQGDFFLSTSREGIMDCDWNTKLTAKVPEVFLKAVQAFNDSDLRHFWLPYTPLGPYTDKLFQHVPTRTVELLSQSAVLESENEELCLPSKLAYVPDRFRDDKRMPVVSCTGATTKYVSSKYAPSSDKLFKKLHVRDLSEEMFLDNLSTFIDNDEAKFRGMKTEWHTKVSGILVSLLNDDTAGKKYRSKMMNMKLIPVSDPERSDSTLDDCRWVTPNSGTILFPAGPGTNLGVPPGLKVFEVHRDVKRDSSHGSLFQLLDVGRYDTQRICKSIVDTHLDPDFHPEVLTVDQLISHIEFLQRAQWSPLPGQKVDLWFATTSESCKRGSSVYVDADVPELPFSATVTFKNNRSKFNFLHGNYKMRMERHGRDWLLWLAQNLELTVIPRMALVTNFSTGEYRLTNDFKLLMDLEPQTVLLLLRHWWHYYQQWIVENAAGANLKGFKPNPTSRQKMHSVLSSLQVQCRGGGKALLRQTYLPRESVIFGMEIKESLPSPPERQGRTSEIQQAFNPVENQVRKEEQNRVSLEPVVVDSPLFNDSATIYRPQKKSKLSSSFAIFRKVFHALWKETTPASTKPQPPIDSKVRKESVTQKPEPRLNDIEWSTASLSAEGAATKDRISENREINKPIPSETMSAAKLLLDVPDPESNAWDFLEHFGVVTKIDASVFLTLLRRLKYTNTTKDRMVALYKQIHSNTVQKDLDTIRKGFANEDIVYIPGTGKDGRDGHWTRITACVWEGPDCLKGTPRLETFYSSLADFFSILPCPRVGLETLVKEAKQIDDADSLHRIEQVFCSLGDYLRREDPKLQNKNKQDMVYSLRNYKIFPTRRGIVGSGRHQLQTAKDSDEWYIADSTTPARAFGDQLDFLALSSETWKKCALLFKVLGILDRRLSVAAYPERVFKGHIQQGHPQEKSLKKKMRFVIALISASLPEDDTIIDLLKNIKFFQLEGIMTRWTIKSHTFVSEDEGSEAEHVVFKEIGNELHLYMVKSGSYPDEIAAKLWELCGIKKMERFIKLYDILKEPDIKVLEDKVRSWGIPFDPAIPDDDSDGGENYNTTTASETAPTGIALEKNEQTLLQEDSPEPEKPTPAPGGVLLTEPSLDQPKLVNEASFRDDSSNVRKQIPILDGISPVVSTADQPGGKEETLSQENAANPEDGSLLGDQVVPVLPTVEHPKAIEKLPIRDGPPNPSTSLIAPTTDQSSKKDNTTIRNQVPNFEEHTLEPSTISPMGQISNQSEKAKDSTIEEHSPSQKETTPVPNVNIIVVPNDNRSPRMPVGIDGNEDSKDSKLGSTQSESSSATDENSSEVFNGDSFSERTSRQRDRKPIQNEREQIIDETSQVNSPTPSNNRSFEKNSPRPRKATERDSSERIPEPRSRSTSTSNNISAVNSSPRRNKNLEPHSHEPKAKSRSRSVLTHVSKDSDLDHERTPFGLPLSDDFLDINRGWIPVPRPMTVFSGENTQETIYFGELYVSRYFESFLGRDFYKPNKHWTSTLRIRNGHTEFKPQEMARDTSTFTIEDTEGKLMNSLVSKEYISRDRYTETVTFHIEVCATNGDLTSHFVVSNIQYEKLQKMSSENNEKASHIYILARVYKVYKEPSLAMYLDPWKLKQEGAISLQSQSSYQGCIFDTNRAVLKEDFANNQLTPDMSKIYEDLNVGPGAIRLLELQLEDDDSKPLHGSLHVVEQKDLGQFWAISYVWGPQPNGPNPSTFTTEKGQIPITESLASCLRCLRRRKVTALLWADALCINQKNHLEKSYQVRRMGSLYKRAQRVIIWMGKTGLGDERSDDIDWLQTLHEPFCDGSAHHEMATESSMKSNNIYVPDKDDRHWANLNSFLQHSWFTRAWIIQELVLGRDVFIVYGNSEMKWDCFMETLYACERFLNKGDIDSQETYFLKNAWSAKALNSTRNYHSGRNKFSFLELLEMFYYARSSRPRDKLFSLLNMTFDMKDDLFHPDYDSTDEKVLENYACGFVKTYRALDLLYRAGSGKSAEFCTWIPNFLHWGEGDQEPLTISTWTPGGEPFYAGKHVPVQAEVRSLPDDVKATYTLGGRHPPPVLAIKGYIICTIQGSFKVGISDDGARVNFTKAIEDMRRLTSYLKDYYQGALENKDVGKDAIQDLMVNSLVGDSKGPRTGLDSVLKSSENSTKLPEWPEGYQKIILDLKAGEDGHKFLEKPPEAQHLFVLYWQTVAAFTHRIPKACFFTTNEPLYAGIAPGEAKEGDSLFIPNGAKVPFILRKQALQPYYKLIGECYVHGIMYSPPPFVTTQEAQEICLI